MALVSARAVACRPVAHRPVARRRRSRPTLMECLQSRLLLSSDVLTNHNNAASTGQVLDETLLSPATIAPQSTGTAYPFGRLFTTTLDGQVYAQVLAKANVLITTGASPGIHNVLFAATMHDSLFAIDANTGAILWQDNFTQIDNPQVATIGSPHSTTGVTTCPSYIWSPELGILSTPVIDSASNILYLLANTQEFRNGSTPAASGDRHFVQRLWAINLSDGSVAITPAQFPMEPATGGMVIGDTIKNDTISSTNYRNYLYVAGPWIKGTGNNADTFNADGTVASTNNADGWIINPADSSTVFHGTTPSASGDIAFNAVLQMNRVAVSLINGEIYLGFASHGDAGPYYGWLLGYDASTLANTAAFVTIPTFDGVKGSAAYSSVGGIWTSGAGITTDGTYLYFTVGNGSFNPAPANFSDSYFSSDSGNHVSLPLDSDYGDSVLKVALDPNATQANVNLKNATAGNPTPDDTYNPDGGYNVNGYGLKVVDFFTPSNVWELNVYDEDLGSGGVLLIPSTGPGSATAPNGDPMISIAGKEGRLYLLDANNLGGYNTQYITDGHQFTDPKGATSDPSGSPAPYDRVLGEYYYVQATGTNSYANDQTYRAFGSPSWYDGELYIGLGYTGSQGAPEIGFSIDSLLFPANVVVQNRTAIYASPNFTTGNSANSPLYGVRGTVAEISANGPADPSSEILWNTHVTGSSTDSLIAYDSSGRVLFNSNWPIQGQSSNTSDTLTNGISGATGVKFSIPTEFNGVVYVPTGGGSSRILGTIAAYGFLPSYLTSAPALFSAPSLPVIDRTAGGIGLSWTLNSTRESEVRIDRSSDGSTWSALAYLPHGSTTYVDANTRLTSFYYYRVVIINAQSSAASPVAAARAFLPGDATLDYQVNGDDLAIVVQNIGKITPDWTDGNFTGDRIITLSDLSIVFNHMDQSSPTVVLPTAQAAPVLSGYMSTQQSAAAAPSLALISPMPLTSAEIFFPRALKPHRLPRSAKKHNKTAAHVQKSSHSRRAPVH